MRTYERGQWYKAPSGHNHLSILEVSETGSLRVSDKHKIYWTQPENLDSWDRMEPNQRERAEVGAIVPPLTGEVRVTDPKTGGQKGQKDVQISALDPLALEELGRVAAYGAKKYARYNYLQGFDWHLTADACWRHTLRLWAGEDIDPESGCHHGAHIAWHGLSFVSSFLRKLGTDDRFKGAK